VSTDPRPGARVLVCGSRTFTDPAPVEAVLNGLFQQHGILTVIEGGAQGADTLAAEWAAPYASAACIEVLADWAGPCGDACRPGHRRKRRGEDYCPTAGLRRNQQMLDETEPDLCVAFVDKPLADSRGTADMVHRADKAGVPVWVVQTGGLKRPTNPAIAVNVHAQPPRPDVILVPVEPRERWAR
jgi:hypothetical protein